MEYWNSYEIYWDTYINKWYDQVVPLLEKFFEKKTYGEEVDKLDTIINCSPGKNFKIRSKFSRKEKSLFFDIVISYDAYMSFQTESQKKEHIAECFLKDIDVLSKYKPKGFNLEELKTDCRTFFQNIGWLG